MSKRGEGKGNTSGAKAKRSSKKSDNKSKQVKELAKNVAKEETGKIKSNVVTPAKTSSGAKAAKGKKKGVVEGDETGDGKTVGKSIENMGVEINTKVKLRSCKKESISQSSLDVQKMECLVAQDSEGLGNVSSEPERWIECCAYDFPAHIDEHRQNRKISGKKMEAGLVSVCLSKEEAKLQRLHISEDENKETEENEYLVPQSQYHMDTDLRKQNLDPKASIVQDKYSAKNEKKISAAKNTGSKPTFDLQYSKDIDKRKLKSEFKASDVQEALSSEDGRKISETNTKGSKPTSLLHYLKNVDERKLESDLKDWTKKWEGTMIKRNCETELESEAAELMRTLQCSKDSDGQNRSLDQKASAVEMDLDSGRDERKITESSKEGNNSSPLVQSSKDIDEQKLKLDLKDSKVQQEHSFDNKKQATESETKGKESTSLLKDSKLLGINERIHNLDLRDTEAQEVISFGNQNKANDPKTEETIHLRKDANMRFEFDDTGNKKVMVNNKDQYTIGEKQKLTFDIGDGNVRLSFIDKKICLFIQNGEIGCSVRKNQVLFSLTDSTTPSDPSSKNLGTSELSVSKDNVSVGELGTDIEDTVSVEDLSGADLAGATEQGSIIPSVKMSPKGDSENVLKSTSKTDPPLVPKNDLQRSIRNTAETFLESFLASCHDFESSFLGSLKQGNEDENKE